MPMYRYLQYLLPVPVTSSFLGEHLLRVLLARKVCHPLSWASTADTAGPQPGHQCKQSHPMPQYRPRPDSVICDWFYFHFSRAGEGKQHCFGEGQHPLQAGKPDPKNNQGPRNWPLRKHLVKIRRNSDEEDEEDDLNDDAGRPPRLCESLLELGIHLPHKKMPMSMYAYTCMTCRNASRLQSKKKSMLETTRSTQTPNPLK